jgi:mannose-6-phosphate isomerase-like protein (cupin superfamily)
MSATSQPYQFSVVKPGLDSYASSNGRRDFFEFCDLGIATATNGDFGFKVCRSKGDGEAPSSGWHYHPCNLQVLYCLRGWVKLAFANGDVIKLEAGMCMNIPPGTIHNEIEFSDDFENLEFASPAEMVNIAVDDPFATVSMASAASENA